VLFPQADKSLRQEDWQALASAHTPAGDPLFSGPVDQRFAELHRVISDEAGCGCAPA
jgi:hypothetical protein